jgi:hypothetical protein
MKTEIHKRVYHEPGEIVWGRIFNGIEDRNSSGKWRPVVILEPGDQKHRVIGLTSQRAYKTTCAPRVPIPNPTACGLRNGGFIWSPKPSWCLRFDLGDHIGWADNELAAVIATMVDANWSQIDRMLDAVARRSLGGDHGLAL